MRFIRKGEILEKEKTRYKSPKIGRRITNFVDYSDVCDINVQCENIHTQINVFSIRGNVLFYAQQIILTHEKCGEFCDPFRSDNELFELAKSLGNFTDKQKVN